MPKKAPNAPEPEGIDGLKARLSLRQINDIAEMSELYLEPEASEFTEGKIIENLGALLEIARQQKGKMSKRHARRIEKIAICANAFVSRHFSHSTGGGGTTQTAGANKAHHNRLKQGNAEELMMGRKERLVAEGLSIFKDEKNLGNLPTWLAQIGDVSEKALEKTVVLLHALRSDFQAAETTASYISLICTRELDNKRYRGETQALRAERFISTLMIPEVTQAILDVAGDREFLMHFLFQNEPAKHYGFFTHRDRPSSARAEFAKLASLCANFQKETALLILDSAHSVYYNNHSIYQKAHEVIEIPEVQRLLEQNNKARTYDDKSYAGFLVGLRRNLGKKGLVAALNEAEKRFDSITERIAFVCGVADYARTKWKLGMNTAFAFENSDKAIGAIAAAITSGEISRMMGNLDGETKETAVRAFAYACAKDLKIADGYGKLVGRIAERDKKYAHEILSALMDRAINIGYSDIGFDPFTKAGLELMKALTQASNGTGRIYMRMNLINDRCERFKWHRIASERILPNSDIEATRLNREITSISGKYAEGGHFLNGIICDMLSGAYYPGQNSIISGEKKYKFKEIYGFMTSREFAMLYDGFVKDRKNGPMGLYTFIYQCNRLPLEKVKLGIRELAPEFSGNHEQLTAGVMAIAKLTQTSGVTDVAALKMFLKGAPEGEVAKYMECFAYLRNNGAKFGWERELECVKTALSPDVEKLVQNHPKREKEEIRRLYNAVVSVNTQESAATNTENVAETLAVAAFKAQSTLQRISHEMSRPCVGVYILSTGFGLRAPVPSMRQFDNQYLSNQALLDKAYSRLFGEDGKNAPADLKIKRVRMEFVSQVKTKLNLGVKGLERKADQMKCSLDVASEWMNNGILDSYVYQTAYKVASGAGGIKNGSAAAKITDKIRDVCMDAGYPVVIVDHSTVRTRGHSTLKISSVADSSMGRAIAQIAARMKPPRLSNDSVKWLSVLNNWNVGDLMTDGKAPSIVGFNLYSGIEFKSAGGARKSNWLPTDDKAFYVGRSWNEDNVSSKETLNSISMDEDFQIKNTNVTSDYWRYFRNKYSAFESQQRLDWAKKLRNVVLFDVDGTLIEAKQSYDIGLRKGFEKIIEMLKEQKVRVSMEEIGSAYQKVRRESKEKFYDFGRYRDMEIRFYSMLLKLPGKVSNNEQIIATLRTVAQKAYGEYIAERNARSRIYPEAIETLRKLNEQGYDVVLMTDRRDSEVQSILQMRDADGTPIEKYVKGAIVTNDLVSITDTDVPICRLGLPKEIPAYQKVTDVIRPIMMIGDSVRHDVEPVEAFGIEAVRVKSGHGFEKVFEALEKRSEEKS